MSADEHEDREPELDALLPWLANDTLEGDERARAEAYLARSAAAREEMAYLRGLRASVKAAEAGPTPGELGLKRIERRLREERRAAAPGAGWWRPAAIAAAILLAVQGAVLVGVWQQPGDVVTAGTGAEQGVVLQATFAPDATEREIRAALEAAGATIAGGPGALGVYRLRLPDVAADNEAAIERALAALRARGDVVTSVDVAR